MTNYLPSKLPSYLLRLNLQYNRSRKFAERDLIAASRFRVIEETIYDNWNGGTYGHGVFLYLPVENFARIDIDEQADIARGICADLNKLATSTQNEHFNAVHLEMEDENDPEFQRAVPFSSRQPVNPDTLSIWKPGLVRLFISHRDQYKSKANELATALEEYGVSSFVAHDTIRPTAEWRREIMKGLETMEVMLVYLTDDFSDSIWTNQELGFALGKAVPIISLKLGRKDPPGFISHEQALRGHMESPVEAAKGLYPLIAKAVNRQERLNEALINSFAMAPDFTEAKRRFDRMAAAVETLNEQQLTAIIEAFHKNDQLHNAIYLTSKYRRLKRFLEKSTDKEFDIEGRVIQIRKKINALSSKLDDEIPF